MLKSWLLLAAATALIASAGIGEAKEPPAEMRSWCFENKDFDCSGPICSCCIADEGCWICDRGEEETDATCHWDDKYSRAQQLQNVAPGGQTLTVDPGPTTPPRRGQVFRPGGTLQLFQEK